ncbi:MAG TPA: hypothetical protein VJN18_11295 [Polyangiaceae bacterium]|nr:hypothetical protein [Polyangiaceae bacterium]
MYQLDNIAEIRSWLKADAQAEDAASRCLQILPPTKWLRDLWTATQRSPVERQWASLPDDIVDAWSRGEDLAPGDVAFLVQVAGGENLPPAAAATRTLGLLIDAQPGLEGELIAVLERGLKHTNPAIRAASAEAIWIANAKASAPVIRDAAAKERDERVKDYLLHAAQLLSKG